MVFFEGEIYEVGHKWLDIALKNSAPNSMGTCYFSPAQTTPVVT